jgi:chromosome segregation ATPase
MLTRYRPRALGVLAAFSLAAVSAVAAQSALTIPPKTDSSSEEFLAEVRGLRADLQQAAKISVRAQLLVGRLQLQEHRINAVAAQVAEVRHLIGIKESGRIPVTEHLKRLDTELRSGNISAEHQRAMENEIAMLKAQLAQMQREEQQLRSQEIELSSQLTTEQGRWQDFNSRLDELEGQLPVLRR